MSEISIDLSAVKHENRLARVKEQLVYVFFIALTCIPIVKYLGEVYLILPIWLFIQFYSVWHRNGTFRYLLQQILSFGILISFAYLAAGFLVLTVLLNLLIPFLLIVLTAKEYDKMSYYNYIFLYGFMEVFFEEFGSIQGSMITFAYITGCFTLMFIVCTLLHLRKRQIRACIPKALNAASNALLSEDIEAIEKAVKTVDATRRRLSLEVYDRNIRHPIDDGQIRCTAKSEEDSISKISSTFIMVFTLIEKLLAVKKENKAEDAEILKAVGNLLAVASTCFYAHEREAQSAIMIFVEKTNWDDATETPKTVKRLLTLLGGNMALLADFEEEETVKVKYFFRNLFASISLDDFKFRLAVRMSIALTIAFIFTWIIPSERSYWIVYNTIFLMMPVYEDVKKSIPKRTFATLIGIVIAFTYINFMPADVLTGPIVLIALFAAIIVPNSMVRAVCGTIAATIPATAVVGGNVAFVLRLIFFGVGIVIVLFVNRFIFKTNNRRELQRHFKTLLLLDRELIKHLQAEKRDYFAVKLMLIRSVLVFASVQEYAKQEAEEENENELLQFVEINRAWQLAIAKGILTIENREKLAELYPLLAVENDGGKRLYEDKAFLKTAGEAMTRSMLSSRGELLT